MSVELTNGTTPDPKDRLGFLRLVDNSIASMSDAEKLELIGRIARSIPKKRSPEEEAEVARVQRENLLRFMAEMEALPCAPNPDGFSGRDHDKILYGSPR